MKIFDSLHGFIHCNEWESKLIDSRPFQRLRYIHHLGNCYLVFPGATHTRFEHSLGVMEIATRLFDSLSSDSDETPYWRQIIRLAALCHDLGHLPFSHIAESRLIGEGGHEKWTLRIIESLKPLWHEMDPNLPIAEDVAKMALGKEGLAQLITGNLFGADRIDYLLRDARMSGLNYGLFDYAYLIESLQLLPSGEIIVQEKGREASEALLIARSFMQKRLYHYPPAKAYGFHLARFMQKIYSDERYFQDLESYLSMSEAHIQCALDSSHDLEARRLKERDLRFQAILLPPDIDEEYLLDFKKSLSISDDEMEWELSHRVESKNWLYLAPQYAFDYTVLSERVN